ncbi:hypothetical protein C8R42DRAFT_115486 [Lentinula raphanica]|nr:hypothetical protein C8R42DRAFT_115486 [Lentinula raphanica]
MPLFVPILRMFMLFLNVWDTYKTLKPPPYKIRNGKAEPPSVRSVTQRKRDLKGCLAVWIVWCCFSVYERHVEPIISLFIPFYNEFKSLVILFLIFTRARGAEPIFLHILRPMLRPYTKSIDSSLELFRLIGDILFAIISFPLRPVAALVPSFFRPNGYEDEIPPPYSEAAAASGQQSTPISSTLQQFNGHVPSFHPTDPEADMEWRQYPKLPSAYPPTPLATSSRLPSQGHGQVGYDPGPAAGPHTIWIPPVAEEDEPDEHDASEDRQDFHRSLLPPRRPLHPGFGNHDGSSDESDRGAEINYILELPDIQREEGAISENSSVGEAESMDMDDGGEYQYNSDDSDEDSFNITLQSPRVPLSLQPSSATASRSTIRLRASARSVFADLERETEGTRHISGLLSPIGTAPSSGQESSPSSIDPESLSISSGDDEMSLSLSNSLPVTTHQPLALLSETDNDGTKSDSSLGSAADGDRVAGASTTAGMRFVAPSGRGRKRSHSRSFPAEYLKRKAKPSTGAVLQRLSSVESTSSSPRTHSPTSDSDVHETNADTTLKAIPTIATVGRTDPTPPQVRSVGVSESEPGTTATDDVVAIPATENSIGGPRKRRKVISASSGQGSLSSATSESEAGVVQTRPGLRRKALDASLSDKRKTAVPSTRTRRQRSQPASNASSEGADDLSGTDNVGARTTIAKGKGRAVAPVSSVPTRKRFDVSHKSLGASTSTIRTTKAMAKPISTVTDTEESNKSSDSVNNNIASSTNNRPLRLARERARGPN